HAGLRLRHRDDPCHDLGLRDGREPQPRRHRRRQSRVRSRLHSLPLGNAGRARRPGADHPGVPPGLRGERPPVLAGGRVLVRFRFLGAALPVLRAAHDEKDMTTPETPSEQPPVNVSDEQVSWDVSLMYQLNDDWNLSGRVANGFRAPSIQGRNIAFLDPNPFSIADSETILSTEVGFKSVLGERVRLNGAVYYYTIDDMQLSAIGGNTNSNVLVNA